MPQLAPHLVRDLFLDTHSGAYVEHRDTYGTPGQSMLHDGRSMAQVLPTRSGVRGTVLPTATRGGVPTSYSPHDLQNTVITIDPHIHGSSIQVPLGALQKDAASQALDAAVGVVGTGGSVVDQRLRAATAMHVMAHAPAPRINEADTLVISRNEPRNPSIAGVVNQQPKVQVMGNTVASFGAPPVRRPSPMEAIAAANSPPVPVQPAVMSQPQYPQQPYQQAPSMIPQPEIEATFEMQGLGQNVTYYHAVVAVPGFLVVIYDERYRGPRYFPPDNTELQLAVQFSHRPEVYLVNPTGLNYTYENKRHCILSVSQIVTPEQPGQE